MQSSDTIAEIFTFTKENPNHQKLESLDIRNVNLKLNSGGNLKNIKMYYILDGKHEFEGKN